MSVIYYTFAVSDSTIATGPQFVAALVPVVVSLRTTGASPGVNVSSHASIAAVGGGIYQIAYDAEAFGEAAGVIDCTATIPTNSDRYLPITLAKDSSRIQAAINASGKVVEVILADTVTAFSGVFPAAALVNAPGGTGGSAATISLSQVGLTPRALGAVADGALTVGDALVCAIAAAAGKQSVTGTTYTIMTPSTGATVRSFTLDSSTAPTSRT